MKKLVLATLVVSMVGCGTRYLETTTKQNTHEPMISYHLPATQMKITVNRYLTSCKNKESDDNTNTVRPEIVYATSLTLEKDVVQGKPIYLDFSSFLLFDKTVTTIKYHDNGSLEEIYLDTKDETFDVAMSVVKAAVDVALVSQGMPPVLSASTSSTVKGTSRDEGVSLKCNSYFGKDLQETVKEYKKDLDTLKGKRKEKSDKKQIAVKNREGMAAGSDEYKAATRDIEDADKVISESKRGIAEIQQKLDKIESLRKTSFIVYQMVQAGVTPDNNEDPSDGVTVHSPRQYRYFAIDLEGERNEYSKWFYDEQVDGELQSPEALDLELLNIVYQAYPVSRTSVGKKGAGSSNRGLVYRVPAKGTVKFFVHKGGTGANNRGWEYEDLNNPELVLRSEIDAFEFGQDVILPFVSELGQSSNMRVQFTENGILKKVQYGIDVTTASKLQGAVSDMSGAYITHQENKITKLQEEKAELQTQNLQSLIGAIGSGSTDPSYILERQQIMLQFYALYGDEAGSSSELQTYLNSLTNDQLRSLLGQ